MSRFLIAPKRDQNRFIVVLQLGLSFKRTSDPQTQRRPQYTTGSLPRLRSPLYLYRLLSIIKPLRVRDQRFSMRVLTVCFSVLFQASILIALPKLPVQVPFPHDRFEIDLHFTYRSAIFCGNGVPSSSSFCCYSRLICTEGPSKL